jgi:2-oxoglutarate ferredoxin oxidoreductase subunit gamma
MASDEHRIIVAGFGGQGVLTLGRLLCTAAMKEGRHVTYLPSYGSEVRGGTANCHVVISPEEIFSPYVELADSLIVLNQPSFDRFGDIVRPGGLVVANTSLVDPGQYERSHEVTLLRVPATEQAAELGNVLVANVMLLGAFLGAMPLCGRECVEEALRQTLSGRKSKALDLNLKAYAKGAHIAQHALQRT